MNVQEIELKTADGVMPVFEARPDAEPKGAVVVFQEAFGVTEHIKDVCRRLAEAGWLAAAPSLFHRDDSPIVANHSLDEAMPYLNNLTQSNVDVDVAAVLEWFSGQGYESEHVGVVGFCAGGTIAAHVASTHSLGAAVTFYGAGIAEGRFGFAPQLDSAPALHTPWLGIYGDEDSSIPTEQVEQLREVLLRAKVEAEVERFAGAGHAFNNDQRPELYNAVAADEAWARTLAWFEQHIVLEG